MVSRAGPSGWTRSSPWHLCSRQSMFLGGWGVGHRGRIHPPQAPQTQEEGLSACLSVCPVLFLCESQRHSSIFFPGPHVGDLFHTISLMFLRPRI